MGGRGGQLGIKQSLASSISLLPGGFIEAPIDRAVSWKRPLGNRGLDFSSKMFMKPINSCLYWPGSFRGMDVALRGVVKAPAELRHPMITLASTQIHQAEPLAG